MKAYRQFTRLTLKAETVSDLEALEVVTKKLAENGSLSEPVIIKTASPRKEKPKGKGK